jgi:hypothetical protein
MGGKRYRTCLTAICVALGTLVTCQQVFADDHAGQTVIANFGAPPSALVARDPHIDLNFDVAQQQFLMKVPAKYTDATAYGLVVYLGDEDAPQQIPPEWDAVLDQRKLIFVEPQQAGKDVATSRRLGAAVLGAMCVQQHFKIDRHRVFASGYAEGARMAGLLGFYAPDIFVGSVQMCGADFYLPLGQPPSKLLPGESEPYGTLLSDATPAEIDQAKKSFRFGFITNSDDPHGAQITNIVNSGYAKNGFHCKLFNVPGVDQHVISAERMNEVLDFLEDTKSAAAPTTRPVPPAWMAQDPSEWPEILLSNRLVDANGGIGDSGSASLARLPNGVVVLCTARHLLGDTKLVDFQKAYKSWTAYRSSQTTGVRMTRVAMDLDQPAAFDALVLCPISQSQSWPGKVLTIRQEPLNVGDTVYLVAVPHGHPRDRQDVFKGIVVDNRPDGQLQYNVDGEFDTMGCSGAPILDEYGQLAAVNVGHLLQQTIPGKRQLLCIAASDVLAAIHLPDDVHAEKEKPVTAPIAKSTSASPVSSTQTADVALRRAQLCMDNQIFDKAREQLQAIISTYPNTDAAKRASVMLAQIPKQ